MKKVPQMSFAIILVTILGMVNASSSANIISSTFDTDVDGWSVTDVINGGHWDIDWSSTGGLPDGHIYKADVGPGGTVFSAPLKFLGDKMDYLGETISFDIKNNVADYEGGDVYWNLMLVGEGINIVNWGPYPKEANVWVHVDALLNYENWTYAKDTWRDPIAEVDFLKVINDVDAVYIHADWGWGLDTSSVDNFVLIPEPISIILFGLGGLALRSKRR